MPNGINALELRKFFRSPETTFGKSIQRNWQFNAMFIFNPLMGLSRLDVAPEIQPFHILDITIPTYEFEKVVMMYGQVPKSMPVLKFEGFNIDVVMEEDEKASVEYFINWNQRNIINKDGLYNAPDDAKITALIVEIQDKTGDPVIYYIFHDLYYLAATPAAYSYQTSESIKRTVTFGVDRVTEYFTKQNLISKTSSLFSSIRKR
jgi:hypothetical protein